MARPCQPVSGGARRMRLGMALGLCVAFVAYLGAPQPATAALSSGRAIAQAGTVYPPSAAAPTPQQTTAGRPLPPPTTPGGEPVDVAMGVYLIQVSNLDQINQTFEIEGYLEARWLDPRLAFDANVFGRDVKEYHEQRAASQLGETVWWPSIEIVNASAGGTLDRYWLRIEADGAVSISMRFNATVTSAMDVRRFPFDQQQLRIPIESYYYGVDDVRFVVNDASTGFDRERALPEWTITEVRTWVDEHDYVQYGEFYPAYSRFNFELRIHRQWPFYLWKIFVPLLLIVAGSWSVFYVDDLATNITTAFTIMLTVVAFNFSIADTLPKVPYLTFMDAVLLTSYVSVFLTLIQLLVTANLARAGREDLALELDRRSRWLFPPALAAVIGLLALMLL